MILLGYHWANGILNFCCSYFPDQVCKLLMSVVRHKPTKILWLTHWGRETKICVGFLTIIGSDNGLSPGRRQAIIGTNVGILLIGTLETNFSEILIEKYIFSFKKMHHKVSSGKWRPFCLGRNVLSIYISQWRQPSSVQAILCRMFGIWPWPWTLQAEMVEA